MDFSFLWQGLLSITWQQLVMYLMLNPQSNLWFGVEAYIKRKEYRHQQVLVNI